MMKRITLLALLAAVCVLPVHGTTLTFVNDPYAASAGPYNMELNGVPPIIPMVCYSDTNNVQPGQTWNVEALNITDLGALVGTKFGAATLALTITDYNEIGYLSNELFASPGNAMLQNAIWAVLGLGGSGANADNTAAAAAVAGGYVTSDIFWVPLGANGGINTSGPQPFVQDAVEPGLLLMLGSGLLGLIGLSVRRRNLVSC